MKKCNEIHIYGNNNKIICKKQLHIKSIICIFQTIGNMGCRLMARRLTVNQVIGGSSPSVPAKADSILSAFLHT